VLNAASERGLFCPIAETVSDRELEKMLFPTISIKRDSKMPDLEHIHREMSKSGVTLSLLWHEYSEICRQNQTIPYQYSRFCKLYTDYAHQTKATMRIHHKPAEKLEVDWAGQHAYLTNNLTGSPIKVPVFVAVLPYSGYAYVEAFPNMNMQSWIQAHVNCFKYMGGVARILVPDNLKTGVDRISRDSSVINKTYNEMANYYNTVVIPARVRRPKDKASVEGTVGIISTWILASLRNRNFFSLRELNRAISEKLNEFNNKPFQAKDGCRERVFRQEEQELLLPLPEEAYELATWATSTVGYNYHIMVNKMYYSVPFEYIHHKVDIRITSRIIEVFYNSVRIASHRRLQGNKGLYQTVTDHMPKDHQEYQKWDADRFLSWARSIGPNTELVIKSILGSCRVEQQGYRTCMAVLSVSKKYTGQKLENTCQRALSYTPNPSYRIIKTILNSDEMKMNSSIDSELTQSSEYAINREAGYYGRNDDDK
jgi:transposase